MVSTRLRCDLVLKRVAQEAGNSKQKWLGFRTAKAGEGQALREESERRTILFVTKRVCQSLVERFFAAVRSDALTQSLGLSLQTKLRRRMQNMRNLFVAIVAQRPNTAARMREGRCLSDFMREDVWIEQYLWYLPVHTRPGEEFRLAPALEKDVENGVVECGIRRVPVTFPIAISEIEFDCPMLDLAGEFDRDVPEVGSALAVPDAELDDPDRLARHELEFAAEIAREPARLKFELGRQRSKFKERSLLHARGASPFCVTLSRTHANYPSLAAGTETGAGAEVPLMAATIFSTSSARARGKTKR